jgi:PucR C-terminal helix-turn-helix domain/GGDEF-like domain
MKLLESSLPRMNGDTVRRQVAEVAEALYERSDELANDLARAIINGVRLYQASVPLPFETVVDGCATNMRAVLEAIAADTEFDTSAATKLGIERARDKIPLASVMEAYRIGFRGFWDAAVTESAVQADRSGALMRVLTAKIIAAQDIFTSVMADAYRVEQSHRALTDESERSVLIDAVLHGRLFEQSSVWEAADYLRLPSQGPFVVIAAEVPGIGAEALPEIESKLRSMDVYSAWRLLPDLQVGVVHIKTDKHLGNVLALISRMATIRVGVSAQFVDLRETAQALRFARVMLRGHADPGLHVTSFDGSILGTAAVSAPEIMVKLVTPTIERFAGLADNERDILFDTFRVWLENDGSLRTAGELLFCHPNTVRYRLHRIEQRTGRCLTKPRDVAELSLAFEVHRRLMWQPEKRRRQKADRP